MRAHLVIFLPILVLQELFCRSDAKLYWDTCALGGQELVELAKNPDTGEFYSTGRSIDQADRKLLWLHNYDGGGGGGGSASGLVHPNIDEFIKERRSDLITPIIRRTAAETASTNGSSDIDSIDERLGMASWEKFYGRSCICGEGNTYCLENFTHCASVSNLNNDDYLPGCFVLQHRERFVRSIWPFICVWFGGMATFIVCTKAGHSIIDYMISCCFPEWNGFVVDRIIRNDPTQARVLFRRYRRARRRATEQQLPTGIMRGVQITQQDQLHVELGRTNANRLTASELTAMSRGDRRPVTQLALKTRIYRRRLETEAFSPYGQTERHNDDEVSCAICFAQIEEGERVGSLSCDHIFHSHCLKSWLKRRNICPLCQISNVAKPIYGGEEEDDSESKDDEQGERRDPYYESELDGDLVETGRRLSGDGFFVGHLSSSGVESRQDQDGLFSEDPGTHHNSSDNGVV